MTDMHHQEMIEQMALIRCLEESLLQLFSQGRINGTTHACIGQESIAVALGANVTAQDYLFCPHRCHGHFIAYGGAPEALIGEMMGRANGVCGGRGGSQHLHYKRFFSNGVQGGIVGNAVGAALALKLAGDNGIAVAVLGDGTLGEGLVYESLNFAALKALPILFLLENNQYAQTTPTALAVSGSMTARAQAFGVEAHETDSSDVMELYGIIRERIRTVREERRPVFQVVNTYRLMAHSKGDDMRDADEVARHWQSDPLLLNAQCLEEKTRALILERSKNKVAQAIDTAEQAPLAEPLSVFPAAEPEDEKWAPPLPERSMTFQKALNEAIHTMMRSDERICFMGEDVLDPYSGAFGISRGLSTAFPKRVITTPISEAGLVAWGVGAALAGQRPIVEIMFGDFLALAADQLLNHAAKYRWISNERVQVPLVVRTPMGGGRGYGPTHSQSIEKMFLGIPGLRVVAPNAILDPGALLRRCVAHSSTPTLFIEHKSLYPYTLEKIENNRLGNFFIRVTDDMFPTVLLSLTDFDTPDVSLIAYGGMTPKVLEAAERLLLEEEITADVIIPSQLYPVPASGILSHIGGARLVATVEEGQPFCGWGAEIIASIAAHAPEMPCQLVRIAAAACPVPAAMQLEKTVLPSTDMIIETIIRKLK